MSEEASLAPSSSDSVIDWFHSQDFSMLKSSLHLAQCICFNATSPVRWKLVETDGERLPVCLIPKACNSINAVILRSAAKGVAGKSISILHNS